MSIRVTANEKFLSQGDSKPKILPIKEKPVVPVPYIPPPPKHQPKFKDGQLYKPPKIEPLNPTKKQILEQKKKAEKKKILRLKSQAPASSPQPLPPQNLQEMARHQK